MDLSGFDWSGGDLGNLDPYTLPKGDPAKTTGGVTASLVKSLGSGIVGGFANSGAAMLGALNPAAGAAQVGAQALKAGFDAAGRPDDLKGTAATGAQRGGGMHNVHIVNFGGTQTASANPGGDSGDKAATLGGGPNWWIYAGGAVAALIALKIMKG